MGYTNQFNLEIGTTLNTTNVQKKLKEFNAQLQKSSSTKIDIPVVVKWSKPDEDGIKKPLLTTLKSIYTEVNTYKDEIGNTFKEIRKLDSKGNVLSDELVQTTSALQNLTTETHKFVDSKGAVQTWTTSIDNAGKTVSTRTKQIVDDVGNITTTTYRLVAEAGKPFKKVGQDITKVSELLRETTTETSTSVGQITDTVNGVTKTFDGTITTIKKISSNGEELTTVISKYTDEMGRTIEKTEQFNKAGVQVATTMRKIGEASKIQTSVKSTFISGDGTKTVTEYANGVATLRTVTREYTNTLGALVKETQVYDEQTHKLISLHTEEVNNQKKVLDNIEKEKQLRQQLTTTTRESEQFIIREGQSYKAVIKTIQEETHDLGTLTTTITTYKNKLGETVVETQKFDSNGKAVAQTTRTITKELGKTGTNANKASSGIKNLGDSAERANYGVRNLGWSLSDAFSRLTNFYLASLPIRAVQTAITDTIQTIKDFDSALIEFRKVSDLAGESLTNYVAKLAEIGEITGSTMQAMVEAAT